MFHLYLSLSLSLSPPPPNTHTQYLKDKAVEVAGCECVRGGRLLRPRRQRERKRAREGGRSSCWGSFAHVFAVVSLAGFRVFVIVGASYVNHPAVNGTLSCEKFRVLWEATDLMIKEHEPLSI